MIATVENKGLGKENKKKEVEVIEGTFNWRKRFSPLL